MRTILLSAYACEPGRGSEPGVGWNLAKELSSKVSLWVITRENNRGPIEASDEAWINDVHWIYWDPPHWLTFWKKGGRGVQLFYILWQFGVRSTARRIVANESVDLTHHVTFGRYWIPSRLASLPCPFIFGPVGGGECTPPGLVASQSLRGKIAERTKVWISTFVSHLPGSRSLYQNAAWTFAATEQTAAVLRPLGVERLSVLPQSGIRQADVPNLPDRASQEEPTTLRLITAARLIHWKGVDLAIEAVAEASQSIDVRLVILQTGPDMERLKALAKKLDVNDRVEFSGRLPKLDDVYEEISKADALVHAALHEAFGQACLESLALGVPVICLDWGGPGLIVDRETGFAIEPGSREETIARLAQAMVDLATELENGKSRADACRIRAFDVFDWKKMADSMVDKYEEVIGLEKPV